MTELSKVIEQYNEDTISILRYCHEHETLMRFNDDARNYAFNVWWDQIGADVFEKWYINRWEIVE